MGKFKQFMFRLPSLPEQWYRKLNDLCKALEMTQWQVTILGYRAILHIGKTDADALKALVAEIKTAHPAKMNASGEN